MTDLWRYRLGFLLVTTSAIAWSTAGFFTRLIPLDTWTMLLWRGMFGGIALLVFIGFYQGRQGFAAFRQLGRAGWGFVAVGAFTMMCFVMSLRMTTVAHSSIIYATIPLVAAGLAWVVLRERPSKSTLAASAVTLIGVTVMVGLGSEGHWSGDLLAVGMTVGMAVIMVIARRHQNIPVLAAACLSAFVSCAVVLPLAQWSLPASGDLTKLALFGVVNFALGLALFAIGSKMLPAAETALIGALDAPLAPIWVMLAFAEVPSRATWVGGVIVFAAIFAHMAWSLKPKTSR